MNDTDKEFSGDMKYWLILEVVRIPAVAAAKSYEFFSKLDFLTTIRGLPEAYNFLSRPAKAGNTDWNASVSTTI